jgi:hypothetical protein
MKSKILPIAIICLLWSCTDSTKKNETVVAEDTTKTTAFKPANFEEQLIYNRAVEAVKAIITKSFFGPDLLAQKTRL